MLLTVVFFFGSCHYFIPSSDTNPKGKLGCYGHFRTNWRQSDILGKLADLRCLNVYKLGSNFMREDAQFRQLADAGLMVFDPMCERERLFYENRRKNPGGVLEVQLHKKKLPVPVKREGSVAFVAKQKKTHGQADENEDAEDEEDAEDNLLGAIRKLNGGGVKRRSAGDNEDDNSGGEHDDDDETDDPEVLRKRLRGYKKLCRRKCMDVDKAEKRGKELAVSFGFY